MSVVIDPFSSSEQFGANFEQFTCASKVKQAKYKLRINAAKTPRADAKLRQARHLLLAVKGVY